jgi:thiol-disulfide isomerase/thioredoxin
MVTARVVAGVVLALAGSAPICVAGEVSDRLRGKDIAGQMPPLEHPEYRPAPSATHMREEDLVLGVVVSGRARAYPWWILKNYHVVNDTIGKTPVAVSLCEQCSGGGAFRREHNGRVLSMEVAGVYNGTILLRDRETKSLWAPFSGRAIEGPLVAQKLDRLPLSVTHWDQWVSRHPETDVVWAPPGRRSGHGSWYTYGKWGIVSEMGSTIQAWDPRLPENTLVYGVESGEKAKSYPFASVRAAGGVLNDQVGPTSVVVVVRGPVEAAGYGRRLKGRLLTFRPSSSPEGVMVDGETTSLWSWEGEAVQGPLKGERLEPLDGYSVEWHVWSAYNPRAEVYEPSPRDHSDPPRTDLVFPQLMLARLGTGALEALKLETEVNLVALWAAWCPPCRVDMPVIQDLVRRQAARGLSAVGIAIHIPEDLEREAVRQFVGEAGITFPTYLVDEPGYEQLEALTRNLGGPGLLLPTVFVVDKRGRVLAAFRGKDVDALPEALARLLPPESSPAP